LVSEITVRKPSPNSGGADLAFKRCAPVYPTASAAVQLTMEGETCKEARIVLGCVGLTPIRAKQAESALRGAAVNEKSVSAAVEAARIASDPQPDMRGSAEYKHTLVGALVKRAIDVARRRALGEKVELSHIYA
jgi:carbon-monoxide dehydrogenase medium subunit